MATILSFKQPSEKNKPSSGEEALDNLTALVAEDIKAVNRIIAHKTESQVTLIPELAAHIIGAGGKRLRPVLTLACAKMCGYEGDRHQNMAASIEFIHTATLLHDDVVDASDLRRGIPSANVLFGNQASVLVGDFLLSRAFQLVVEDGAHEVMKILSQTAAKMAEGEVMQLTSSNDSGTGEQAYLDIVRAKTAELFAAACRMGAVVAKRPAAEEEALRAFGLNLGIAFQIADDVLDYAAEQDLLGKTVGNDFTEGKITLPVILAIGRGSAAERAFWRRTLEDHDIREGDFGRALTLLKNTNALRDARERARHYAAMARDALGPFPPGLIRQTLQDVADFTVQREF